MCQNCLVADEIDVIFQRGMGVATAAELIDSGVSRDALRQLIKKGAIRTLSRGVYAPAALIDSLADSPGNMSLLLARAATKRNPDLVASHTTAARIHGLDVLGGPGLDATGVTLTRHAHRASRSSRGGMTVYVAALPEGHVTTKRGVPITTVPRTVADVARIGSFRAGVVAADCALRLGLATNELLGETARECIGWPGSATALRVAEFADGGSDSPLESVARVVFDEHGLDPPFLQYEVSGPFGYIGRVDFCWPVHRIIAEADGAIKYENPDKARAQLLRDQLLREAGWHVIHFGWRQVFAEPERVVSWIRSAGALRASLYRV